MLLRGRAEAGRGRQKRVCWVLPNWWLYSGPTPEKYLPHWHEGSLPLLRAWFIWLPWPQSFHFEAGCWACALHPWPPKWLLCHGSPEPTLRCLVSNLPPGLCLSRHCCGHSSLPEPGKHLHPNSHPSTNIYWPQIPGYSMWALGQAWSPAWSVWRLGEGRTCV